MVGHLAAQMVEKMGLYWVEQWVGETVGSWAEQMAGNWAAGLVAPVAREKVD